MNNQTRRLWKKIDKIIPGLSYFFDPAEIFNLDKNEQKYLNFVSRLILEVEKKPKKSKRKDFAPLTKLMVLQNQNHRCNICNNLLNVVDFDHIDGNRSNNKISNCQALCPNCHAKKT